VHPTRATGNVAVQGIDNQSGRTVASGDSFSANSYVATVSATESSNGERSPGDPGDEFWADDDAPEPAAEPSALALIHDALGGEVIAAEDDRRPIRWRDDGIPAIGDRDPAA
jgi:hypothetical protein